MDYKKQLKTPEWKFFREKVFKIKGKKCSICGDENNLQIHHPFYAKNKKPWEYNPIDMIVLCSSCHKKIHGKNIINKEQFFLTYTQALGLYKNLNGSQIKILTWLILNQSTYNSNMVTLTKSIKEKISKEMNISLSSVNNSVPILVKKKVLIREGGKRSATYLMNPEYFWKGDLSERNKKLKFISIH